MHDVLNEIVEEQPRCEVDQPEFGQIEPMTTESRSSKNGSIDVEEVSFTDLQ